MQNIEQDAILYALFSMYCLAWSVYYLGQQPSGQPGSGSRVRSLLATLSCSSPASATLETTLYDLLLKDNILDLQPGEDATPFKVRTGRGNNVACIMITPAEHSNHTLIYR